MDIRPWPRETYDMLHTAVMITKGLLCDKDFDLKEHETVYMAYLKKPYEPTMHLAMQISCMGHKLPDELREYAEAVREDREDVKPIVDEFLKDL